MFKKYIFPWIVLATIMGLLSSCKGGQKESPVETPTAESQVQPTTPAIPPTDTPVPAKPPTVTQVPLTRPAAVKYHTVYDPVSKQVLLIGFPPARVDVWAYDVASQTLTRLKDKPATYIDCLDYNTAAGGVVTTNEASGATWLYDPAKDEWKELKKRTTDLSDGNWGDCSFIYDTESGKQIVMGNQIFDYSSNAWSRIDPEPIGFWDNSAMAYDSESDRVLAWDSLVEKRVWAIDLNTNTREMLSYTGAPEKGGGFGAAVYVPGLDRMFVYYLDQFYAYDYNSNTWEQAKGELKPGSRIVQSMAYDPAAMKIVLYGGQDENGTVHYNDLWLYDPKTGEWTQQPLP